MDARRAFVKRYLATFTVSLIVTKDFLGPGTAPFTKSKLFSASTLTTSRFCTVTLTAPICPGIPFPLNTLLGLEHAPLELVPVTVLQAGPCVVTQIKTVENDGYSAVQVGFIDKKDKIVNKDANGKKEIRNRHGVTKVTWGSGTVHPRTVKYTMLVILNPSGFLPIFCFSF